MATHFTGFWDTGAEVATTIGPVPLDALLGRLRARLAAMPAGENVRVDLISYEDADAPDEPSGLAPFEAEYVCPNGHQVSRLRAEPCDQCGALVMYEPMAAGMALHRYLETAEADVGALVAFARFVLGDVPPPPSIQAILGRYPAHEQ